MMDVLGLIKVVLWLAVGMVLCGPRGSHERG